MKKTVLYTALFFLIICSAFQTVPKDHYVLDPGHTYFGFDVERFMVGEVSGRFNKCRANIEMRGDDFTSLSVKATIEVSSLDSNNKTRDGHLKGAFWLDAAKHPSIVFISKKVEKLDNQYFMTGDFTIKGITKEIQFPIDIQGPFVDPTQNKTLGIKADFSINRFDYNISFNKKMDNGSLFIGDQVKIKIRALAIKK